ncbi:hypothetical protein H3U64_24145 [Pseudomonas fluorescens]|nr:hypothetical protein [Pseudomonas fluorescens]
MDPLPRGMGGLGRQAGCGARKNLRGAVHTVLRRFHQHQPQFKHLLNGQGQVAMVGGQVLGKYG